MKIVHPLWIYLGSSTVSFFGPLAYRPISKLTEKDPPYEKVQAADDKVLLDSTF